MQVKNQSIYKVWQEGTFSDPDMHGHTQDFSNTVVMTPNPPQNSTENNEVLKCMCVMFNVLIFFS